MMVEKSDPEFFEIVGRWNITIQNRIQILKMKTRLLGWPQEFSRSKIPCHSIFQQKSVCLEGGYSSVEEMVRNTNLYCRKS